MSNQISLALRKPDYQLNDNRITRILEANTLDEATRMGLWDRIKDWFQGGVKKESIERLYNQIASPESTYDAQPAKMIERFFKLRSSVEEKHQSQFRVELLDEGDTWRYMLKVGETTLYKSEFLGKTEVSGFNEVTLLEREFHLLQQECPVHELTGGLTEFCCADFNEIQNKKGMAVFEKSEFITARTETLRNAGKSEEEIEKTLKQEISNADTPLLNDQFCKDLRRDSYIINGQRLEGNLLERLTTFRKLIPDAQKQQLISCYANQSMGNGPLEHFAHAGDKVVGKSQGLAFNINIKEDGKISLVAEIKMEYFNIVDGEADINVGYPLTIRTDLSLSNIDAEGTVRFVWEI